MGVDVEVKRIALMEEQVLKWNLPPAPAKVTDSRTVNWDGLGQVELDAIEPKQLIEMVNEALDSVFDFELYQELKNQQSFEKGIYIERMKEEINDIFNEE